MGNRAPVSGTETPVAFEGSLAAARAGDAEAMGRLLDGFRRYLLLVADQELDSGLRVKVAGSDLVQQTFLQAQRAFDDFAGNQEAECRGWLRQILLNELAKAHRSFLETGKRDLRREVPPAGDTSSAAGQQLGQLDPPSGRMRAKEDMARLAKALAQLPEDHRQVVELRNDLKPWEEIGRAMNRSAEAARKLWARAVERLGEELGGE
jgi:RNA polymerase sigma-70 factor (ECF subfamily)